MLHHTAALALLGWYLMMPPMAADLDPACASHGPSVALSDLLWALVAWRNPSEINMIRCDLQRHDIRPDAPVNRWRQVGEFETLGACKAQYEKNQEPVAGVDEDALSRNIAKMEFLDEGERHPSEEELKLRGETIAITVGAQILAERCFATDDPRLGSN